MNFTREPIIETIITPREGYKLLVRNSKGGQQEDYQVDSVEVISFGHSFFFRSMEKPRCFLLPVGDYEIAEVKEVRVVLKNVSADKTIKIGGGRESSTKATSEATLEPPSEFVAQTVEKEPLQEAPQQEIRLDRRRDRRRMKRRRGEDFSREAAQEKQVSKDEGGDSGIKPFFASLIPPPTTLISETLYRYKEKDVAVVTTEGDLLASPMEQKINEPFEGSPTNNEANYLQRFSEGKESSGTPPDESHFIL